MIKLYRVNKEGDFIEKFKEDTKKERVHFLDEIRGLAIFCMLFHHAFYDIGTVLGRDIGYELFDFFKIVQPFFWFAFIFISGVCTNLSRNVLRRGCMLMCVSFIITFVTAVIMPFLGFGGEKIYFGVIHCLASCMIFTGLFKKLLAKINFKIALPILLVLFMITYNLQNGYLGFGSFSLDVPDALESVGFLFPIGITSSSFYSSDYFPLFPWLFMFLMGVYVGGVWKERGFPKFMYKSRSKFFAKLGRYSLYIYIAHQPILFALFALIGILI